MNLIYYNGRKITPYYYSEQNRTLYNVIRRIFKNLDKPKYIPHPKKFLHAPGFHKKNQGRDFVRELVRIRDKHTCQNCGKWWQNGQRRFDIHHLNGLCGKKSRGYDKLEDMSGLITYCHKCHFQVEGIGKKISEGRLSTSKSISLLTTI